MPGSPRSQMTAEQLAHRREWTAQYEKDRYNRLKDTPEFKQQKNISHKVNNANRAAEEWGVPGHLTAAEVRVALDPPICGYCGGPANGIDHFVPMSAGGPNTTDNILSCCRSCNSSKRETMPDIFLVKRGFVTS